MSTPLPPEPHILLGLAAVAGFLGISERQARHLAGKGNLPVFKLKKSGLVAARPESLRAWLAAEEAAALAGLAVVRRVDLDAFIAGLPGPDSRKSEAAA